MFYKYVNTLPIYPAPPVTKTDFPFDIFDICGQLLLLVWKKEM